MAVWRLCLSVEKLGGAELEHAGTNLGPELSAGWLGSYQQTITSQGYETDAISLGLTYGLSVK